MLENGKNVLLAGKIGVQAKMQWWHAITTFDKLKITTTYPTFPPDIYDPPFIFLPLAFCVFG